MLKEKTSSERSGEAAALRERVDGRLAELVPPDSAPPERLHRAIRYSLLAPGKRIRPTLTLLATRSLGGSEEQALDAACAVEMVHAASLIVDDMPFMDDADERRGLPSAHREFGLEVATLASLALLNRAFSVLAQCSGPSAETRINLVNGLSVALGDCGGAIAGQEEDLESPAGDEVTRPELEKMVLHKTAALFVASVEFGAFVADASSEQLQSLRDFAWRFGLCFQALDDLADRPCPQAAEVGACQDHQDKVTFVSLLGVEGAWEAAEDHARQAVEELEGIGLERSELADLTLGLVQGQRNRQALIGL